MTLLHLSDTHSQHTKLTNLPPADIIVHSGDITFGGSVQEAMNFINWFSDLPYKHKIFVAGNHDCCLCDANIEGLPDDVHYLCGTSCTIEGLHFHGIPHSWSPPALQCCPHRQRIQYDLLTTGLQPINT